MTKILKTCAGANFCKFLTLNNLPTHTDVSFMQQNIAETSLNKESNQSRSSTRNRRIWLNCHFSQNRHFSKGQTVIYPNNKKKIESKIYLYNFDRKKCYEVL